MLITRISKLKQAKNRTSFLLKRIVENIVDWVEQPLPKELVPLRSAPKLGSEKSKSPQCWHNFVSNYTHTNHLEEKKRRYLLIITSFHSLWGHLQQHQVPGFQPTQNLHLHPCCPRETALPAPATGFSSPPIPPRQLSTQPQTSRVDTGAAAAALHSRWTVERKVVSAEAPAQVFAARLATLKVCLTTSKTECQPTKTCRLKVHQLKVVTSARKLGAITPLLTVQPSFLRRNWKPSSNTKKYMEIIIMAQKKTTTTKSRRAFVCLLLTKLSLILKLLLHWLKPTPRGRG